MSVVKQSAERLLKMFRQFCAISVQKRGAFGCAVGNLSSAGALLAHARGPERQHQGAAQPGGAAPHGEQAGPDRKQFVLDGSPSPSYNAIFSATFCYRRVNVRTICHKCFEFISDTKFYDKGISRSHFGYRLEFRSERFGPA